MKGKNQATAWRTADHIPAGRSLVNLTNWAASCSGESGTMRPRPNTPADNAPATSSRPSRGLLRKTASVAGAVASRSEFSAESNTTDAVGGGYSPLKAFVDNAPAAAYWRGEGAS